MTRYDLALVSCGAKKATSARPARELYLSNLFKLSVAYAEAHADRVLILSGLHGLITPDTVLEPYDFELPHLDIRAYDIWINQMHGALPMQPGRALVLAGRYYLSQVRPELLERGWSVDSPLDGMGVGQRLQWLARQRRAAA